MVYKTHETGHLNKLERQKKIVHVNQYCDNKIFSAIAIYCFLLIFKLVGLLLPTPVEVDRLIYECFFFITGSANTRLRLRLHEHFYFEYFTWSEAKHYRLSVILLLNVKNRTFYVLLSVRIINQYHFSLAFMKSGP